MRGHRRLVRRAADAPRPVPRPAAFPFVPGYDLVGTVPAVGAGVDPALVGTRVAALTKTGGWASHALARRRRPGAGPRRRRRRPRPRRSSSTASPPGRCCTARPASAPGRRSSSTAPTAASAPSLVQLARHAGVRVIGTASAAPPRRAARARRRTASTTATRTSPTASASSRPDGVDAVFDHVGGPSVGAPGDLLARGGTLVAYGTAAHRRHQQPASRRSPALRAARALEPAAQRPPRAFYNFWGGKLGSGPSGSAGAWPPT